MTDFEYEANALLQTGKRFEMFGSRSSFELRRVLRTVHHSVLSDRDYECCFFSNISEYSFY